MSLPASMGDSLGGLSVSSLTSISSGLGAETGVETGTGGCSTVTARYSIDMDIFKSFSLNSSCILILTGALCKVLYFYSIDTLFS